jgi:hypothetical protein
MSSQIPFFHRCKIYIVFWAITVPAVLVVFPLLILAVLNPLWFREDALQSLQDFIKNCARRRAKIMQPMLQKYKLFDVLKNYNSNNSNTGVQGSP